MPNFSALLKTEVVRLARREISREVAVLRKTVMASRHDVAAIKRQLAALQKTTALLEKRTRQPEESRPVTLPDRPVRFVAKGLRSLRARLGLSASQLGLLLGVTEQSVYNWETKHATPRPEPFAKIIALRAIGRSEAHARLEAMKSPRARKPTSRRS